MERIYLDNNSTTAVDPRVFQAMAAELTGPPSNPSSLHWFGQRARGLLNTARQTVAHFFGSRPEEISFTSGGTESTNTFLRSLSPGHLITTQIEHSAVDKTIHFLAKQNGFAVTYLPVGLWGAPLPDQIAAAIRSDTRAIILSAANNETGVQIDIEAVAQIAHTAGIPLFLDAVAYIGKEPFILYPGITAVALSGHKFHAPKGIGALFVRNSFKLEPLITGGNQEMIRRAGTENLAGIIGLAKALQILQEEQPQITQHITHLRRHFERELQQVLPRIVIHGQGPRISNTSNIAFPGLDGETLLMHLDMKGVAASHGSACSSGAIEPSRILTQMGIERKLARSSLRFSFSRMNTEEEINQAIEILLPLVQRMKNI